MRVQRIFWLPALVIGLALGGCTAEQTEEGALPDVEGGNLPEYDVDPADVEIGTDTETVVVPDVDVEP